MSKEISRRDFLRILGTGAFAATAAVVLPDSTSSRSNSTGEMPTTGASRPGPVSSPSESTPIAKSGRGEMPTYGEVRPGPMGVVLPTPAEGLGEVPTYGGARPGPVGPDLIVTSDSEFGEMPTTGASRPGPVSK